MDRITINPPELKDARSIGYNHGIIANGAFFMAGQVAMNADGEIVGDDIETQAHKAYENVGILLEYIGKDFDDIAKVTTHIIEPYERYHDGYKDVYWDVFDDPYPCHTVLGVHQLAHEDYLVEIEVEVPLDERDVGAVSTTRDGIERVS